MGKGLDHIAGDNAFFLDIDFADGNGEKYIISKMKQMRIVFLEKEKDYHTVRMAVSRYFKCAKLSSRYSAHSNALNNIYFIIMEEDIARNIITLAKKEYKFPRAISENPMQAYEFINLIKKRNLSSSLENILLSHEIVPISLEEEQRNIDIENEHVQRKLSEWGPLELLRSKDEWLQIYESDIGKILKSILEF